MAKVYNGKVMIPGDKIEQYLKIMAEAEKKREPFRQLLLGLKLVEEKSVGFHNTRSTEGSSSEVLRFPRRKQGYRQREGLESFAVNTKKDNKGETRIQGERP